MSNPPAPVAVPKRKLLEVDIEDAVCVYARRKGWLAEKFQSEGKRSVPDRLFSGQGRKLFFIEFKRPGNKPTVKQANDHEVRRALGFHVYVVDDIDEGKRIVDMWDAI